MPKDTKSPHLSNKFRVVGVVPGRVVTRRHGTVDLRTITLELAQTLYDEGFPYLQPIGRTAPSARSEAKGKE